MRLKINMLHYLQQEYDWRSAALTAAYDELPLWSAAPGQLLLEEFPYAGCRDLLDIGCGTGFPLLLLARRLGPRARAYGVDSWAAALARAADKCRAWGLSHVTLLEQDAVQIALPDQSIDRIASNLGLLNFEDVGGVLGECRRLLRPDGRLCISTNLRGTFQEYYAAFEEVADADLKPKIQSQAQHRHDLPALRQLFDQHGFDCLRIVEDAFSMTYADGTAFLHDYFIGMGFLPSWKALVPPADQMRVFAALETRLNAIAAKEGRLRFTIPIAYLELRLGNRPPSTGGNPVVERGND